LRKKDVVHQPGQKKMKVFEKGEETNQQRGNREMD
jgi:hypothetical protein